jgi:hypothetical protein
MSKVLSSLIALVLVGAVATADIGQTQNYLADLNNGANLVQCETTASSLNSLLVDNKQCAVGGCATAANQFQMGAFNQTASAGGLCAVIGLLQQTKTDSAATQVQLITNGVGAVGQEENLALQVGQVAAKSGGEGSGVATQLAALAEGQTGSNAATAVHQLSAVASKQDTSVSGSPTAEGTALATMQATTSQTQLVN